MSEAAWWSGLWGRAQTQAGVSLYVTFLHRGDFCLAVAQLIRLGGRRQGA